MRHLRRTLTIALALGSAMCGPYLPPTTVPAAPNPSFDSFRSALQAYVDASQPYRKQAAQAQENTPGKATPTPAAETAVRRRQDVLADALRTKVRPNAHQGDIFVAPAAKEIHQDLDKAFAGLRRDLLMDALAEENDTGQANAETPAINARTEAPRIPPILREMLPSIPQQLEYAFAKRALILRDVDAQIVVDYLPDALPVQSPAGVPTVAPANPQTASTLLPMPGVRGGLVVALIGDSGSGDLPQEQVATAMLTYFNSARRFPLVLMLGDNLYDDDYTGEFLTPYKPLLDRGVEFFAALGNHDRDLEIHFKPFNMGDRDFYSFDRGNARFVALNSNHPTDLDQFKWLETAFDNAGTKWRICFYHHPPYTSGQHAAESRDVIRPAFEPAMIRNKVNVVFSGHDHLYDRIAPQHGVHYFVSGGGGRSLYNFHRSPVDEVVISAHHFMVIEIAGDVMLFEAITPAQKLLDCGVIYRTSDAEAKGLDKELDAWASMCKSSRPVTTTAARP